MRTDLLPGDLIMIEDSVGTGTTPAIVFSISDLLRSYHEFSWPRLRNAPLPNVYNVKCFHVQKQKYFTLEVYPDYLLCEDSPGEFRLPASAIHHREELEQ